MSLFDRQAVGFIRLEDAYPDGKPFVIVSAWSEGKKITEFGENDAATIAVVSPDDLQAEPTEFRVWGPVALQVGAIEPGELPAFCVYMKGTPGSFEPNRLESAGELSPEARQMILNASSVRLAKDQAQTVII